MMNTKQMNSSCIFLGMVVTLVVVNMSYGGIVTTGDTDIISQPTYRWYVGVDSVGTLQVDGGSTPSITDIAYIGQNAGSDGTATITGAGSSWTTGQIRTGMVGKGVLNILAGGLVKANDTVYIGQYSTADNQCNINGSGSTLDATGQNVIVGQGSDPAFSASGTTTVSGGGQVLSQYTSFGEAANGIGYGTLTGTGTKWMCSTNMVIGKNGIGELLVEDGALLQTIDLLMGNYVGSSGLLKIQTGGMVALSDHGGSSATTLSGFLDRITSYSASTMAVEYYDEGTSSWDDINNATLGVDYTLQSGTGDLAGYTVLTAIPEPATALLLLGLSPVMLKRYRKH